MPANEEDSNITRDVKPAREDLKNPDGLLPSLMSLTHVEPALREKTYSDLNTEIVATE